MEVGRTTWEIFYNLGENSQEAELRHLTQCKWEDADEVKSHYQLCSHNT